VALGYLQFQVSADWKKNVLLDTAAGRRISLLFLLGSRRGGGFPLLLFVISVRLTVGRRISVFVGRSVPKLVSGLRSI
jgi:hypothetical protein